MRSRKCKKKKETHSVCVWVCVWRLITKQKRQGGWGRGGQELFPFPSSPNKNIIFDFFFVLCFSISLCPSLSISLSLSVSKKKRMVQIEQLDLNPIAMRLSYHHNPVRKKKNIDGVRLGVCVCGRERESEREQTLRRGRGMTTRRQQSLCVFFFFYAFHNLYVEGDTKNKTKNPFFFLPLVWSEPQTGACLRLCTLETHSNREEKWQCTSPASIEPVNKI